MWGVGGAVSPESAVLLGLLQDIFQRGADRDRDGVSIRRKDAGDLQRDMDELWDLGL